MKKIIPYWPELLILLICAGLLLGAISEKNGYHMDEMLSFELANAQFNPWIVPTQPQGRLAKFVEREIRGENAGETFSNLTDTVKDVLRNRGNSKLLSYQADVYEEPVWIDRQSFTDYITVDEQDDFNYLSVYFNVKDDNHPPLHFMMLHTVSSVFKGKVTPLMGCGINLLCVIGIMLFLMKLGRRFMRIVGHAEYGRIAGDGAALLYGLSAGAISTTLLIRMYAMLTFFCVAALLIHVEKMFGRQGEQGGFGKGNKCLILVTILGFWTQYFFLFYCLILAAVTAVILWREQRKRELYVYIRSMVTAAVIGVAGFPFAVSDVFSSGRGVEALQNLASGLSGYGVRLAAFGQILVKRTGVWYLCALLVAATVCLIAWIRKGKEEKNDRKEGAEAGAGRGCLLAMLLIPAAGYFLLAARMSPYLVDRYIMPLFPIVMLILTALSLWAVSFLAEIRGAEKGKRKRFAVAAGFLLIAVICQAVDRNLDRDQYLYPFYGEQEKVAEDHAQYPCICVYEGFGYYENLPEFIHYDRTLLVTLAELETRKDTESISALDRVVVLLKNRADRQQVCGILEGYGLELEEVLYDRETGSDEIFLFVRAEKEKE